MPRVAQISREAVLDAALRLADADGLAAVTMRAVAADLGVTSMALYRHVRDKDELLDGLVELLLAEIPTPADLPWDEQLTVVADGIRKTARAHPNVFGLMLARPASTPAALRARQAVLDALVRSGQPADLVARLERLLSTFLLGFAASEASGRFRHHPDEIEADYEYAKDVVFQLLRANATTPAPATPAPVTPGPDGPVTPTRANPPDGYTGH